LPNSHSATELADFPFWAAVHEVVVELQREGQKSQNTPKPALKMKLENDLFSGYKIYPSKGRLYVRGDSKVFRFMNGKSESLFLQRKNPRRIAWTQLYRRAHKKGLNEETAKKRSRRTVKHQRGIVGADLSAIAALRNQSAAARTQQRQVAIEKAKADKKEKEAKKEKTKARPNAPSGPKVSKQQMKGGKGGR